MVSRHWLDFEFLNYVNFYREATLTQVRGFSGSSVKGYPSVEEAQDAWESYTVGVHGVSQSLCLMGPGV